MDEHLPGDYIVYLFHVLFIIVFTVTYLGTSIWILLAKAPTRMRKGRRVMKGTLLIFGIPSILSGGYILWLLPGLDLYQVLKLAVLAAVFWLSYRPHRYKVNQILSVALLAYILGISISKRILIFNRNGPNEEMSSSFLDDTEAFSGKSIYTLKCEPCHGDDGKLGVLAAADLSVSTLSLEDRKEVLSDGRILTVMRAFKHELTPGEIEAVASYIEELRDLPTE